MFLIKLINVSYSWYNWVFEPIKSEMHLEDSGQGWPTTYGLHFAS
jgi:hypothetical protein